MQPEELSASWSGEELVIRHDDRSQAWMLVAVHSTALGPAMGGTRMKVYRAFADAVTDVLQLAEAMTRKQAMAGLAFGGGKAVLDVPEIPARGGAAWRGLFRRYGDLVDALGGTYVTAADMHTGSAEMDVVGERTPHVLGRSPAVGGSGDAGRDTGGRRPACDPRLVRSGLRQCRPGRAIGARARCGRGRRTARRDARRRGGGGHRRRTRPSTPPRGGSRRSDGDRSRARDRHAGRRVRALRRRRDPVGRDDPAAEVSRRGGRRQQPTRRAR